MFSGKMKAITFSYDDGTTQDRRLVEILNKYGLKATFNINHDLLGGFNTLDLGEIKVDHNKVNKEEVATLYAGHEVAAHTLTHPFLPLCSDEDVIYQVEQDRLRLSELVGYEVIGMAYPGGGQNHDERVTELIRNNTGIKYARTIITNNSFDLQDDLLVFNPTTFHLAENDEQFRLAEEFINSNPDKPQLFYIWGHAFEFDIHNTWDKFEEFCRLISGKSDIFYGTNKQVFGLE